LATLASVAEQHQPHQPCWPDWPHWPQWFKPYQWLQPHQPRWPNKPHQFQVGFISLGFISLIGFISLFGYIGLVGCIGHNGLVIIIGPFKLKTQGVAIKLTSTTKITNAAIWQYCAAYQYNAHLFVRESWLSHVLFRLNSIFENALQNEKQVFLTVFHK
jgi:hypothetical protein